MRGEMDEGGDVGGGESRGRRRRWRKGRRLGKEGEEKIEV